MNSLAVYASLLVNLCRSIVLDMPPEYDRTQIDWQGFYDFCCHHKLENLAYAGLIKGDTGGIDAEVLKKFEDRYMQCMAVDAEYGIYLDMIKDAFESAGIDYLILKGMIMKPLFPSPDLRQVADIDIYLGSEGANLARPAMESIGFTTEDFGEFLPTDNYRMGKGYIEIHRVLIRNDYAWTDECNKIPERLIRKNGHEMAMTDEDFYVFMIAHIAKHMKHGGIGIRAILDVWIYLRHYTELDNAYISAAMERCSLTEFHENLLKLCGYWFDKKPADDKIKRMSVYVANSGWNGVEAQWNAARLGETAGINGSVGKARLKKYVNVIFWSRERMAERYPVLNRLPFLLPVFWCVRAVNALVNKRDTVKDIAHSHDNIDVDESRRINRFREEIGL